MDDTDRIIEAIDRGTGRIVAAIIGMHLRHNTTPEEITKQAVHLERVEELLRDASAAACNS